MRKRYRATLQALNDDCIGRKAHGFANLEVTDDDALQIRIEMFNTPADMTHMAVLEGSVTKAPVAVATAAQDVNHDGVVDEEEAEKVSGKVFVPLDNAPEKLNLIVVNIQKPTTMAFTFTSSELSCQTCGNSCSNVTARMSSILIMRSCMLTASKAMSCCRKQ